MTHSFFPFSNETHTLTQTPTGRRRQTHTHSSWCLKGEEPKCVTHIALVHMSPCEDVILGIMGILTAENAQPPVPFPSRGTFPTVHTDRPFPYSN